ncbi:MAG: CPBP family intramembrane metalloprotease [Flavobacteriaceae bacterium]|nr:CPBP family intramembrane metalloprotease [Flavobacteriaceae bacterium]
MKAKIYNFLTKPYIVVLTMIIGVLLSISIDRNFNFFTGLTVALLILWGSKYDWSRFGLAKKMTFATIGRSLGITVLLIIGFYIFEGILAMYFGEIDISTFENVRGNFTEYLGLMIIVWVFAAFGEEFIYRGYYMKQLAKLFGNTNKAWIVSAIIVSVYFGVSHAYQGVTGIIAVTLWHLCISIIFSKNKNNLISPILIHGFYDTIGVTLLYLNQDKIVSDWIQQLF